MGLTREEGLGNDLALRNDELTETNVALDTALADARQQRQHADANAAAAKANEEQANANAVTAQENAARAERQRANVLRLSAFQQLEDLRREASDLWPALPERLPTYDAWLEKAGELLAGLEPRAGGNDVGHRRQLNLLRRRAQSRTAAQREAERRAHPRYAELQEMSAQISGAKDKIATFRASLGDAEPGAESAAVLAKIEAQVADAVRDRDALDAEIDAPQHYSFSDPDDTWLHNQLIQLIDEIEAFHDPETGLIGGLSKTHGWGVRRRRDFAATIEELTLIGDEARRRWELASASIADVELCPAYDGLALTPQLGLLPLGRDPDSGLWEFWHAQSGEQPVRGDDDTLVLTEASGIVLVLIPGGSFWMGAQNLEPEGRNYDPQARNNEYPVHEVTLSPYFLSKYEMTQGQWRRFVGSNPSSYSPGNSESVQATTLLHPLEQVSWDDAMLTLPRLGLMLPSEAQWERAARAGTTTVWWTGNERESLRTHAAVNLADQSAARGGGQWASIADWPELDDGWILHAPVDELAPNPFGLLHVHGNLWEWCLDAYDMNAYNRTPVQDPIAGPSGAPSHVRRGGSFNGSAAFTRLAFRDSFAADDRNDFMGLRPARAINP